SRVRYSRWQFAYVTPCAEIVAHGRAITARALNARGEVVLPVLAAALLRAGRATGGSDAQREVTVVIPEPAGLMAEEDRSKRPTVFSAVRAVMDAFAGTDPHLGLYGAFGYDLAFQFEPVTLRPARRGSPGGPGPPPAGQPVGRGPQGGAGDQVRLRVPGGGRAPGGPAPGHAARGRSR